MTLFNWEPKPRLSEDKFCRIAWRMAEDFKGEVRHNRALGGIYIIFDQHLHIIHLLTMVNKPYEWEIKAFTNSEEDAEHFMQI